MLLLAFSLSTCSYSSCLQRKRYIPATSRPTGSISNLVLPHWNNTVALTRQCSMLAQCFLQQRKTPTPLTNLCLFADMEHLMLAVILLKPIVVTVSIKLILHLGVSKIQTALLSRRCIIIEVRIHWDISDTAFFLFRPDINRRWMRPQRHCYPWDHAQSWILSRTPEARQRQSHKNHNS